MSDTGSSGDNKAQQQDEVNLASPPAAAAAPEVENKPVTPAKRTPSKRISAVERAQRESEELVKTLGGSLDIEGGRKTRSSTRGTPSRSNVVATPPPAKKARATSGTPRRGKGRKIDTAVESEQKTTPEKISSDLEADAEPVPESKSKPEPVKKAEESSVVNAAPKTEEKVDDVAPEANATTTPSVADDKQSPAKDEDKPEPMEVDGVGSKSDNETPEAMEITESPKETTTESSTENSHEEKSEESDKVVLAATVVEEKEESSSVAEEKAAAVVVEENKTTEVESKPVENSIGNNIEVNSTEENATSPPTDEVCPTIPPPLASPVSVSVSAGNDHKTESNDFCEPKIASPPITANNDGATPQYCN